jgi:hypothetical protein
VLISRFGTMFFFGPRCRVYQPCTCLERRRATGDDGVAERRA